MPTARPVTPYSMSLDVSLFLLDAAILQVDSIFKVQIFHNEPKIRSSLKGVDFRSGFGNVADQDRHGAGPIFRVQSPIINS
ncbi:unnamed protein product [Victoria cruziana]